MAPDDDDMPTQTTTPRALKEAARAEANDLLWRQQVRTAGTAAAAQPSAQVLNAVASLTTALNGIGTVSTSCQQAGQGPVYISLSLAQVTALVSKLTLGILG